MTDETTYQPKHRGEPKPRTYPRPGGAVELHAYQPDMLALTIEEMRVEDPPCRECGRPKAEHAERPACPVEGCPGDGRYAPPGRGHTCTTKAWMAALEKQAMERAEVMRDRAIQAWLRNGD